MKLHGCEKRCNSVYFCFNFLQGVLLTNTDTLVWSIYLSNCLYFFNIFLYRSLERTAFERINLTVLIGLPFVRHEQLKLHHPEAIFTVRGDSTTRSHRSVNFDYKWNCFFVILEKEKFADSIKLSLA